MHVWESALEKQRLPYLNDHRIQGVIAVPISVYIEMIQAAAAEAFGQGPYVLKEIELKKLLLLPEECAQKVQVVLSTSADTQIPSISPSTSIVMLPVYRNNHAIHGHST